MQEGLKDSENSINPLVKIVRFFLILVFSNNYSIENRLPVLILAEVCEFELDLAAKLLLVCQVDLLSLYNEIPAALRAATLCSC